eukprot:353868-Pleurochrysis_carterae.AAC.1
MSGLRISAFAQVDHVHALSRRRDRLSRHRRRRRQFGHRTGRWLRLVLASQWPSSLLRTDNAGMRGRRCDPPRRRRRRRRRRRPTCANLSSSLRECARQRRPVRRAALTAVRARALLHLRTEDSRRWLEARLRIQHCLSAC